MTVCRIAKGVHRADIRFVRIKAKDDEKEKRNPTNNPGKNTSHNELKIKKNESSADKISHLNKSGNKSSQIIERRMGGGGKKNGRGGKEE